MPGPLSTRPRRSARTAVVIALLAVLGLVVSGCGTLQGTGDLDYVSGDGTIIELAPENREQPVEAAGTSLEGEALDLATLRGGVVVLNVWWSGCGPCIAEAPYLVEAAEQSDATFLGINIRDSSPETAIAFEQRLGIPYDSFFDPGGELLLGLGRFAAVPLPSTLVLDPEGRVAAVINGALRSTTTLTELIDAAAAGGAGEAGS